MFKTETLSTLDLTFKLFLPILLCLLLWTPCSFAQESIGIGGREGVLEVMGHISREGVLAREKPDTNSKVLARLPKGSKIVVLAESGDWYKVRLYNRNPAFVRSELVEFRYELRDEHITKSDIEKKIMVDVKNMAFQFNQMVKESVFSRKYNIVPSLKILDGSKKDGTAVVNVLYCAVDTTGKIVPSMKENPLSETMIKFVEIVLMKMLLYDADTYKIVFRIPVFKNGKIVEYQDKAEYTVERTETDLYELRSGGGKIWDYVVASEPADEFFKTFPH